MTRAPRFPLDLQRLHADARPHAAALLRPQRPLEHAARSSIQRPAPGGLGLDSAAVRQRMVDRLGRADACSDRVLLALARVERHAFVDSALANQAYEDTSLPIGLGQTISKPSVVARMLSLLFEGEHARGQAHLGRVLEIGTGCGYQTALLAQLARHVTSIERLEALHAKARHRLTPSPGCPLRLLHGDGRMGHSPNAPYDAIIAAAGGDELPAAWTDQLAVGGRLVAPLHDVQRGGQVLLIVDRTPQGLVQSRHDAVHFVPLKSGVE